MLTRFFSPLALFMLYLYSMILGLIQGITEFLPISSSGHLVVFHDILKFDFSDNLAFDVAIHWGTLLAVLIFFRREILRYLAAIIDIFIPGRKVNRVDLSEVLLIIYATIPAALIGFFFERTVEIYFRNTVTVIITLFIGAMLFFAAEKFFRPEREFSGMGIGRAIYIGLAQALALIPGLSRSGMTIVAGMSVKLKREEAARFSFLISAPIIFGSGIFELNKINWESIPGEEIAMFILGFIGSFAAGFFAIKYFIRFLQHHRLNIFGWYRIGLAVILLGWVLIRAGLIF